MKKLIGFLVFSLLVQSLFATGSSQASSSAERGSYLAGLGRIIPPGEIYIDSYIAQNDYDYPFPGSGALNVIPAGGIRDNTAYLLVGLRGKKEDFSALPPLNISFVIDISGSMSAQNKLEWVKESFHIFVDQVRPEDFVSVVIFDNIAEVLVKPAQIQSRQDREQFKKQVDALRPRGGTNIYAGMEMGYQMVEVNYRQDYTNRVILLTDGLDGSGKSKKQFFDMNREYKEQGINISTIALGAEADITLMVDMAIAGGGSSRFISDRTIMEQTFGSELDRLVVPAARNLNMEIVLAEDVTLAETWGYSHWVSDNTIHYTLDTLHNGDYETIAAEITLDGFIPGGSVLGNFFLSYEDVSGNNFREGPFPIIAESDLHGLIIEPRVREAEGYIVLGRGLIDIGNKAPHISRIQTDFTRLWNEQNASRNEGEAAAITDTPEMAALRQSIIEELDALLEITGSLKVHLEQISISLGGNKYGPEIKILDNYETSFKRSREENLNR